ncbi:peptidoglycan binding domain-containing protein [Kitasatospora sp. NPDC052896]|uniref:peptidoglycan binding domain-containing protein n=1 Tax=Kitasatospora sp. NPDC052896 TaxID=3364061 RepID=UPI0037C5AD42
MSSRESDNAHPSPRRGGAPGRRPGEGPDAYPSGTPPYGIPGLGNGFGQDGDPSSTLGRGYRFEPAQAPADPEPDIPKTETTLTTRISINIPGSRPIPPVVVRSPVKPEEPGGDPDGQPNRPRHRSGAPAEPVVGVMESGARPGSPPTLPPEWQTPPGGTPKPAPQRSSAGQPAEAESTGEWFRPRQRVRPEPTPAAAPAPTPAAAPGFASGSPFQAPERQPAPPAAPAFSNEATQQIPVPRPAEAPAPPFATADHPAETRQPFGAPSAGYPTDPYATGPGEPAPAANHGGPFQGVPSDPYSAGPAGGDAFGNGPAANRPTGTPGAPGRFARTQPQPGPVPEGRFTDGRFTTESATDPEDTEIGGFAPIPGDPAEAIPGLPVTGIYGAAPGRGGTATAPTAAHPADPAPFRGGASQPEAGGVPGGVPGGEPTGQPAPEGGPTTVAVEAEPAPAPAAAKPKPKPKPRAQKLLVYAVGGALFVGAAVYGTGLMLNQADVPRGTTVLGTDISGDSRDQAVHLLDSTVGKIGEQPMALKLGTQPVSLDPATAGLSFDTTATVDGLTKHSYDPVTVIGSIPGSPKNVPPVVNVDRAKLKAALDSLAAQLSQGFKEGYVQFSPDGTTVVVPGQPGQAIDDNSAVNQVVQAYQDRADGKSDGTITLPLTAAQPKVTTQALQQAADGLGKAITSGKVIVVAGSKKFLFGNVTAAKALTLAPDDSGNIGPQWNLDELGNAMGSVFAGLKFRQSDGTLAPITPQAVADAIASVYDKNTTADRTFTFRM